MSDARIDAPFGPVTLSSPVGAAGPARAIAPDLPEGLTVDGCHLAEIEVAFGAGETVDLEIGCQPTPGAAVEAGPTEGFGLWSVEAGKLFGCFGLRSPAGFDKLGVTVVSYAHGKAGVSFRLRSSSTQVVRVAFAAAWTTDPDADAALTAAQAAVEGALSL